jgi:hypothetical protein
MGLEIQQPGWRMITASVGGHYDEPLAICDVKKGAGTRLAEPVMRR